MFKENSMRIQIKIEIRQDLNNMKLKHYEIKTL